MKSIGGIIVTALCIVLFLFLGVSSYADSLVSVKDIHYHSAFEKQAFQHYLDAGEDADIELLLALDTESGSTHFQAVSKFFNSSIEKYRLLKFQRKSDVKKVRIIYRDLHKTNLSRRLFNNDQSLYADNKSYQKSYLILLGASLFEELNIPYAIVKSNHQISMVSIPGQSEIMIETIQTNNEVEQIDEKFKEAYLSYLIDRNIISRDLVGYNTEDDLFNNHFFNSENIDKIDFIAGLYDALAIKGIKDQNYSAAHQWSEKAYLIHPDEKSAFLVLYALANKMDGMSLNDPEYSKYLAKLMRFENRGVTREQLIGIYMNLTNEQLLATANSKLYDDSYANVISEIQDSLLATEVSFIYNFERGRVLFLNGELNKAEPFVSKAFSVKPDDPNVKSMFFGIMLARMDDLKTGDDAYTFTKFEDYFKKISKYKLEFPALNEMTGFRQAWLYFCLGLMDQSYKFDDSVSGEQYRLLFEKDYPEPIKYFDALNNGIANAYASAAHYYQKENDFCKSYELANRGLNYIPGNQRLLSFKSHDKN